MESLPHVGSDAYTRRVDVVPGIARFRDTCNVYVLRSGRDATLIDFGSGAVLDHLEDFGVDRVTDVLVTHHHRDQVQGLARAVAADARVWVPPVERDLVADVNRRWSSRAIANDYDVRQDRFSLLEQVPVAGTVDEYRSRRYGEHDVYTLPTPGHTMGSVTYVVEIEGRRVAFVGDLVYAKGKVWSLAATQWSYTGVEGQAATVLSCAVLAKRGPQVLLPSHGEPIDEPEAALGLTRSRVQELLELRRGEPWDLDAWLDQPWQVLTPHLLRNRTCLAHSYALLSESGAALLIDWGYDLTAGTPPPTERAARRPLLASLDVLRRDFGVDKIDVVVTTHYHDDHVGGINLLREVEGTQVWSPENVAPVIEQPSRYDLPCLWFDPVAVDRVLEHEVPTTWNEYELTTYPLPGHTLYAAAIAFEVDGRRVLATGDQQADGPQSDAPAILNYQYRNRFRIDDYVASAELYRRLRPDLIVSGHWQPRDVSDGYLAKLLEDGKRVAELHRELLPLEEFDFGAEGFGARIEPYRATIPAGGDVELEVAVQNPFDRSERAVVRLVVPCGWTAEPEAHDFELGENENARVMFRVSPDGAPVRRARIAADLTVGEVRFGQQAEALVDVQ
jgi:glyoxylase-like metal-dependent hydrolase (beta-lactamase superfamily II)